MARGAPSLHTLSIRESLLGAAFFLLPFAGLVVYIMLFETDELSKGYFMVTAIPVLFITIFLAPIGVIVGENVSSSGNNVIRAIVYFISGLAYLLGWWGVFGLVSLFDLHAPVLQILYAILGPMLVPAIVSTPKRLFESKEEKASAS